jgi:serine protease
MYFLKKATNILISLALASTLSVSAVQGAEINLAFNQAKNQSSKVSEGVSVKAVDGYKNGQWTSYSASPTDNQSGADDKAVNQLIIKYKPLVEANKNRNTLQKKMQGFSSLANRISQIANDLNIVPSNINNPATSRSYSTATVVKQLSSDEYFDVIALNQNFTTSQLKQISERLSDDDNIEYAEPDYIATTTLTPNDVRYPEQWPYFSPTAGINLENTWNITTGKENVVVAIIDTGVTQHSDIVSKILTGYDFVNHDSDATDDYDHGTHVAGIVAASTDNGEGVAGIDWQAKILPVKVIGRNGRGYFSDIAKGIRWSAGMPLVGTPPNTYPAQVINMSLAAAVACSNSKTMQNAIDEAVARGVTVVVAAGNAGRDAADYSPASCDNVISVAASDANANRASFSNFGSLVDVIAPGVGVLSLDHTGGYITLSGTSMAAPHVAGTISLMIAKNNTLAPAVLEAVLKSSAETLGTSSNCHTANIGYNNRSCGSGRVNAARALISLPAVAAAELTGDTGATGATGDQGIQGVQGIPGPQGPAGSSGSRGIQGPQGVQGPAGQRGILGPQGTTGANGRNGEKGDAGGDTSLLAEQGIDVSLIGIKNFIVPGHVQIGASTEACDTDRAGSIRYVPSGKHLEFCNGEQWTPINAPVDYTCDNICQLGSAHSSGGYHRCGIKSDNTIQCWGRDLTGPTEVPPGVTAKHIATGAGHTCIIQLDNSLACWGWDINGPIDAPNGLKAKQVAISQYSSCAINMDDSLTCWGQGELADSVPEDIRLRQITLGYERACGILLDSTVSCWGAPNNLGESNLPRDLLAKQVVLSASYSCALKLDNTVECWGELDRFHKAPKDLGIIEQIASGNGAMCSLNMLGVVRCWGNSGHGQTDVPAELVAKQITMNGRSACALTVDSNILCWGQNAYGETEPPTTPIWKQI